MLNWILIAALSGCSTPKGLEAYDSGEEPAGGGAADEATDEDADDADVDADPSAVGGPCEDGTGVLDCELECWADKEHLIGDGVCDDGSRGPNFFCIEFEDDRGDCPDAGGTDDGSGDEAGSGSGDDSGSGSDDGSGSGADGSGTDGSGTDGSGTDGSGTDGSGTDGSGTDGSGTDGSGTDGSGTTGGGSSGDGDSPESSWDDDCGDWTLPDSSTISWSGDTEFAGSGVPSSCSMTGHDVADSSHIWNPLSPGPYCINTDGSEFDTVLSIWDAGCVEELECDADSGSTETGVGSSWVGTSSQIRFTAEVGMSYVIVVDGVRATTSTSYGAYTLNIVPGECS